MKSCRALYWFCLSLFLLCNGPGFSQSRKSDIGSLKIALQKFEVEKRKLGSKATALTDTSKVKILNTIANTYFNMYSDEASVYAKKAIVLAEKINYKKGIMTACNTLGALEDIKGNYPAARSYYGKALKMAAEINNAIGQVDAYGNIGVSAMKQGNYPEATKNFMAGLAIARKANDHYGIAGCLNNLGLVFTTQKLYDKALKMYTDCVIEQKKIKDFYNLAITYQNIGEIYGYKKQYPAALENYNYGLKLAMETDNKQSASNVYSGMAKIALDEKDYAKAHTHIQTCLRLRKETGDNYGISVAYIALGNVYSHMKQYDKAITNINMGLGPMIENGELESMKDAYLTLSMIYKGMGNYKLAYENQVLFTKTNDSIFNIEKDRKLTELQMRYEFKMEQDSIKSAQDKKDSIAKEIAEGQRRTRNFIFAGLGLIVLFLIILLIQRNKLAVIKRQKALEQERSRISRDLHDNLGAQLSTARMFVSSLRNDSGNADIANKVDHSINLLDSSIHDLRQIMNNMHPGLLHEKGYIAATEDLVNKINGLHQINFTLSHHKIDDRFNQAIEHELFRITQELINNTLKYANAKNVTLDILKRDNCIILMYEDDGSGYDPATVNRGNGLGNIEARAKSVKGTVEFDSMPGAGARTIIEIPL